MESQLRSVLEVGRRFLRGGTWRAVLGALVLGVGGAAATAHASADDNVILIRGADPWVYLHEDGYYYLTTTADTKNKVEMRRSKSLKAIANGQYQVVWRAENGQDDVWAPEIHYYGNTWYIYFTFRDAGQSTSGFEGCDWVDQKRRTWVISNSSQDPFTGTWSAPQRVTDHPSLDGTVFDVNGQRYYSWSRFPCTTPHQVNHQEIHIAKLNADNKTIDRQWNPISSPAVHSPYYAWETGPAGNNPMGINEGPMAMHRNGKVFLGYATQACWSDYYGFGMLYASDTADLMVKSNWTKMSTQQFWGNFPSYAAGHGSFTKSKDQSQDWLMFHGNPGPNMGCGGNSPQTENRHTRVQSITWGSDSNGFPVLGRGGSTSDIRDPYATVCQDGNHGGWCVRLGPGSYTLASLQTKLNEQGNVVGAGINDSISSVRVHGGANVTLYNDDNFTGASQRFTADANLAASNDMASSIVVAEGNQHPQAYFSIKSKVTGKCVDVNAGASGNGTVIQQWTCNGSTAQQWYFMPTGNGYVRLMNRANNKPLSHSPTKVWDWGGGTDQQWRPHLQDDLHYTFEFLRDGRVLELPGGLSADGVQLWAAPSSGSDDQRWRIEPVGYLTIKDRYSNQCMDIGGWSLDDGAVVMKWTCGDHQANQEFRFDYLGGSLPLFKIVNKNSNKALKVNGGEGSSIWQQTYADSNDFKWYLDYDWSSTDTALFKIRNMGTWRSLDGGCTAAFAANVKIENDLGNVCQKWRLNVAE